MRKIIAAGLLAICLSAMLAGCGDDKNSATNTPNAAEGTDRPADTAAPSKPDNDLSDDVKDGVDDAADGVKDAVDGVDDAADGVKDGLEDAADGVKDGVNDAVDDAAKTR